MYLWKNNMPTKKLEFPIHDTDRYRARIKFQTVEVIPISVGSVRDAFNSNTTDAALAGNSELGGTNTLDLGQKLERKSIIKKFAEATAASGNNILKKQQKRLTNESCTLYLPPSIQIQDGVQYENMEFGSFASALNNIVNGGSSGADAAIKAIKESSIFSDVAKLARSEFESQDLARVGISKLVNKFGAVGGAVRSSLQTTPNPNMRAIFKSVNLREFSWSFKLIPNSQKESEEIAEIISWFRQNLYPSGVERAGIIVGYRFPPMFRVRLFYGSSQMDQQRFFFKDMHMKSFNANYNSGGMGFHDDGEFSEVDISMSFVETETLTREDLDDGKRWTMLDGLGVG
jgi:hypothetical protein|tara:strand:- start:19073 stop:20104 length:1032 start_codon:yes stop_codon:yes gene_type:complete